MPQAKIALTHNGIFHADDVFAAAIIGSGHTTLGKVDIVRSRNPDDIASAHIVWDVGMVYDHAAKRYDHHMNGAPLRPDGTPYSSVGLIFKHYGWEVIEEMVFAGRREYRHKGGDVIPSEMIEFIFDELNSHLIKHLDMVDNGLRKSGGSDIAGLISDFNSFEDADGGFHRAKTFAYDILMSKVLRLADLYASKGKVLAAAQNLASGHILILKEGMNFQRTVFEENLTDILYCVMPGNNEDWIVSTVPIEPGSFEMRAPLPKEWGGLEREELQKVSGIRTATFTHKALFVGGAAFYHDAVQMATIALEQHLTRSDPLEKA